MCGCGHKGVPASPERGCAKWLVKNVSTGVSQESSVPLLHENSPLPGGSWMTETWCHHTLSQQAARGCPKGERAIYTQLSPGSPHPAPKGAIRAQSPQYLHAAAAALQRFSTDSIQGHRRRAHRLRALTAREQY